MPAAPPATATRRRFVASVLAVAALATAGCAATDGSDGGDIAALPTGATATPVPSSAADSTVPSPDSVVAAHAGEPWFLGEVPTGPVAADPALEPVLIGMVNQEDTPLGSYPEMRAAVEAAVAWANAELGGIDGRPIELLTCITRFDPDESRDCAQSLVDRGVVAFVGGVDVMGSSSIGVIESTGRVLVGGIPASLEEQRSDRAFFFSGGDAGALAAFAAHAAGSDARSVMIAYGQEVAAFEVAARDYGAAVAELLGLRVEVVPFSIFTADFSPLADAAVAAGVDGLMVLAATQSCVPVMTAMSERAPGVTTYLTGACAGADTLAAAGDAADGVLFNAEGPVDGIDVEASIYQYVIDRYATAPAGGAGTVAFRGFMNLYSLLLDAAATTIDADTIVGLARAAVDRPSFWGHPYTCDGAQVPGLAALCAPQQILFRAADTPTGYESVTDWIATDEQFAALPR